MREPVDPATSPQKLEPLRDPQTGHAISPVIAAALCTKPRGSLTADQARKVDALKAGSPAFATMRSLTMRFKGILRGAQSDPLDAWIDSVIESEIISIVRFARTLRRDIDAVRKCQRTALEQRPSRGSNQPTENPQTSHVWPSRPRIAEVANAPVPPHTLRQSRFKDNATTVNHTGSFISVGSWYRRMRSRNLRVIFLGLLLELLITWMYRESSRSTA
jgi:hypothetical protein